MEHKVLIEKYLDSKGDYVPRRGILLKRRKSRNYYDTIKVWTERNAVSTKWLMNSLENEQH